jgi:NADH-quinone oxidoreductase subunit M
MSASCSIAQKRLDWMLGYSSVMHMGYIFLGLAERECARLEWRAVLMFAHGISIALLFALAGEIRQRTGSLSSAISAGLGKVMPFLGLAFGTRDFCVNWAARVREFRAK